MGKLLKIKRLRTQLEISENLYFVALVLTLIANFFAQTTLVTVFPILITFFKVIRVLALLILVVKFFYEKAYLKTHFILGSVIGIYVCWVAVITDNYLALIPTFALIYSAHNIKFKNILKISLATLIACMFLTQLFYIIGFFPNVKSVRGLDVAVGVRQSLGYTFVSFAANYFFHVCLLYIVIRSERLTWYEIAAMSLINGYIFYATDTKSGFMFIVLLLLTVAYVKMRPHKRSTVALKIEQWVLPFGIALSVGLTELYRWNPQVMSVIDKILSTRLLHGAQALKVYGYSLIGQPVQWTFYGDKPVNNISYLYVDSSFLNIIINYGIVTMLLLVIGYFIVPRLLKDVSIYYTIALVFVTLHSTFDPQFLEVYYNPFLLILGTIFSKRVIT